MTIFTCAANGGGYDEVLGSVERHIPAVSLFVGTSAPSVQYWPITFTFGSGTTFPPSGFHDPSGSVVSPPSSWTSGIYVPLSNTDLVSAAKRLQIRVSFQKLAGATSGNLTAAVAYATDGGATAIGTAFVAVPHDTWTDIPAPGVSATAKALQYITFSTSGAAATLSWEYYIAEIDLRVVGASSAGEKPDQVVFDSNADAVSMASDFRAIRPVSMSLLCTYRGPQLNDGGYIAARFFSGVEEHPPTDYGTLTAIPGAYDGPLRLGAYTFWKPTRLTDLEFFHPQDLGSADKGSLVVCGLATDPANAALRVRIVTNWEAITYSRKYSPTPSVVAPDRVAAAFAALAGQPTAFENPLHLAKIYNIAKRAVKQGADLAWRTRHAWAPLAGQALGLIPEVGPVLGPLASSVLG